MTNYKWNISLEKGTEIAYSTLKDILLSSQDFKVNKNILIDILIEKTKDLSIKNYKKRKNILTFLNINYGSFEKYIDSEPCFVLNNNIVSYVDSDLNEWEYV